MVFVSRSVVGPIVAAYALAVAPVQAESLSGRVLDPDGAVVVHAQLRLFHRTSGELRKTQSSVEGAYSFPSIAAGDYLLEGEAGGSALTGSQQITVQGDAVADLPLAISGAHVEVVVTASSTPLTLHETAKALDVIGSEEIALRNEFAVSEAIRNVPGVRVQQLRGPGSLVTVQTRGMRTQDTAVLIDGLRFRDAAGLHGDATAFYQDMTIVDTDRIEFLRGSGSSLYGSHAMAGVINISSHQGGGEPHGEVRAEGGGLGMMRGVARIGGGLDNDRFAYSGGFSHLNVTRGYRDGSPYRNTALQGFAKYNFTPTASLSGRVWGTDAFSSQNESPAFPQSVVANFPDAGPVSGRALGNDQLALFEQGLPFQAGSATFAPDQIDPDARRVASFVATSLAFQQELSPNGSYRLAYQFVDTNRSFQDGPAGPGTFDPAVSNDNQFDGQTHLFQARTDHRIGRHNHVSVGYEYEGARFLNFNTDESAAPVESQVDIDQASHAVFAQDQIRLVDGALQLSFSGRAQFFDLGAPTFSGTPGPYEGVSFDSPRNAYTGDAAAAYFFKESQTKIRAHVGNSFRAPSLFERFGGSFFFGSFSFSGDPRLSPERSVAFDTGIDQWLAGSKVRLSGTFFYTNLQQTVIFDFANFPANDIFGRFGGYRNSSGGIARGAEFSAQFTPTRNTDVRTSYTYTNSDSRTPRIGLDFFKIPGTSDHTFSFTATQWIAKRFNVTFDFFTASDYSQSPFGAQGRRLVFDGPAKADVVLSYDIPLEGDKSVEVYGKVENLFDNQYYEDGFGSPGAWAIGGIRFKF